MNLRLLARVVLAPAAVAALVPMSAAAMTLSSGSAAVTANGARALADTFPDTVGLTTTIVDDTAGRPIEGAVDAGDTVHDVGTVTNMTGSNGTPVGTVYFTFFPNDRCTGSGVVVGSATPDETGFADGSDPQGPLAPGAYSFNAHFVPTDPTLWMDALSDCEPLYVQGGVEGTAVDLTVRKDAHPSFTQTYAWAITKSAANDSQRIAADGTADFLYTVNVSHDDGTVGDWQVNGTITVANANAAAVTLSGIDDTVDNGGFCAVDTGGDLTVPAGGRSFAYTCTYTGAPSPAAGTNTVTVRWDDQALSDGSLLAGNSASWQEPFDFTNVAPTVVDGSVDVTDTLQGDLGDRDLHGSDHDFVLVLGPVHRRCRGNEHAARQHCHVHDRHDGTTGSAVPDGEGLRRRRPDREQDGDARFTRTYNWKIAKAVDKTSSSSSGGRPRSTTR